MKIRITILYRHMGRKGDSEEEYSFDWEGIDYSELFKIVSSFDDQHTVAEDDLTKDKKLRKGKSLAKNP